MDGQTHLFEDELVLFGNNYKPTKSMYFLVLVRFIGFKTLGLHETNGWPFESRGFRMGF